MYVISAYSGGWSTTLGWWDKDVAYTLATWEPLAKFILKNNLDMKKKRSKQDILDASKEVHQIMTDLYNHIRDTFEAELEISIEELVECIPYLDVVLLEYPWRVIACSEGESSYEEVLQLRLWEWHPERDSNLNIIQHNIKSSDLQRLGYNVVEE